MMKPSESRTHPAVTVRIGPWEAEIDVAIAPLIRELWIAGIATLMSCQENDLGKVWIEFPDVGQLAKFLNIVAQFELGGETLYNRMVRVLSSQDPHAMWDYELFPADAALVWPDEDRGETEFGYEGPSDFFFTCSVHFPPGDLPLVFERLQAHNASVA